MDSRIIALALSSIMILSSIAFIQGSPAEGASGDSDDPVMVLGSASNGNNIRSNEAFLFENKADSELRYIDLNTEWFENPEVQIVVTYQKYHKNSSTSWNSSGWSTSMVMNCQWTEGVRTITCGEGDMLSSQGTVISRDASVSITEIDSDGGLYAIEFSARPPEQPGCFVFKIGFTISEGKGANTQIYYFGANAQYQSNSSSGVDQSTIISELARNVCLSTDIDHNDFVTGITVQHSVDAGPLYAWVQLDSLDGTGTTYDRDRFHFYAVGLPDGLNMRSDGIINGKIAGYVNATTTFTVYAIDEDNTSNRAS